MKSNIVAFCRERGQAIRETEADMKRRRRKYFFLWARNSRPVMCAISALLAVITFVMTQRLLDGGNGVTFTVWMVCGILLFASLIQIIYAERGYTVDDWR